MIYEKPRITFQKFHTNAFLDNTTVLSQDDPTMGGGGIDPWGDWDEEGGFEFGSADVFNGTITINSDGVGGWFNG